MPNYCEYSMKIVGSRENCKKFLDRMNDYDEPYHFWRIFEATPYEGNEKDGVLEMYISGYCAWSLESCCRASGYSGGTDLFAVNTKELNLEMEAYSHEPGMEFEEHYLYSKGECLADECVDIDCYWWDESEYPTYAEFKADNPGAPPEYEFDENSEAYTGGFGANYGHWHI